MDWTRPLGNFTVPKACDSNYEKGRKVSETNYPCFYLVFEWRAFNSHMGYVPNICRSEVETKNACIRTTLHVVIKSSSKPIKVCLTFSGINMSSHIFCNGCQPVTEQSSKSIASQSGLSQHGHILVTSLNFYRLWQLVRYFFKSHATQRTTQWMISYWELNFRKA